MTRKRHNNNHIPTQATVRQRHSWQQQNDSEDTNKAQQPNITSSDM